MTLAVKLQSSAAVQITVSCKLGQTICLLLRKCSKVWAAKRRPGPRQAMSRPAGCVRPRGPCSSLVADCLSMDVSVCVSVCSVQRRSVCLSESGRCGSITFDGATQLLSLTDNSAAQLSIHTASYYIWSVCSYGQRSVNY